MVVSAAYVTIGYVLSTRSTAAVSIEACAGAADDASSAAAAADAAVVDAAFLIQLTSRFSGLDGEYAPALERASANTTNRLIAMMECG